MPANNKPLSAPPCSPTSASLPRSIVVVSTIVVASCASAPPHHLPPQRAPAARAESAHFPSRKLAAQPWPFVSEKGPLGTAHPVEVTDSAPDGHWVVLKQARDDTDGDKEVQVFAGIDGVGGDDLVPYFVDVGGPGTRIDDFTASDASGRFVVVVLRGRLLLADTVTRAAYDLGPGHLAPRERRYARTSAPIREPRWTLEPFALFDARGHYLATLSSDAGKPLIQVVDLQSREVRTVSAGDGLLWRIELDEDGHWLVVKEIVADTNDNGYLDVPAHWGKPACAEDECGGDTPVVRIVPTQGGDPVSVPNFESILGTHILRHATDGSLVDEQGVIRAPAECNAHVLFADAARDTIVVACTSGAIHRVENGARYDSRGPLEIHGRGRSLRLPADPRYIVREGRAGYLAVSSYARGAMLDLETRRWTDLPEGEYVISHFGRFAITKTDRGDDYVGAIFDAASGRRQPLTPTSFRGAWMFVHAYPVVAASGIIVDLASGTVLGCSSRTPHAVRRDGAVLVAQAPTKVAWKLDVGPLQWQPPMPIERCPNGPPEPAPR